MHRTFGSSRRVLALAGLLAGSTALVAAPTTADAFCGFYVGGADAKLFNNATVVVLMRDGTRTVLSMQNDYQGPPEDFALVIPVPVVLHEGDVKTLRSALFDRVDKLAAPRLVEYWEVDPCTEEGYGFGGLGLRGTGRGGGGTGTGYGIGQGRSTVKIEAQFDVAEYEIVILSATESTGLDNWLHDNGYNIPDGAEPLLRPYVQQDMKFFVAKVNPKKVKFGGNGRAMLSPLRFHYDSKEFALPVRLGLINSPEQGPEGQAGKQDLLVHVIAPKTRYQVANYPNVTIPTNLDLQDRAAGQFGEFYVSLFDHTLANNPKAVVTEYAWAAGSCDPCPETPLTNKELLELGGDVLPKWSKQLSKSAADNDNIGLGFGGGTASEFVLTRLHARYDASSLGEDLVFEAAPAIVGGREWPTDDQGKPEQGSRPAGGEHNNFQARYAIRHAWEGEVACKEPVRGRWGGPPVDSLVGVAGSNKPTVARQLTTVARGASLGSFVTAAASSQLGVTMLAEPPKPEPASEPESAPVQSPAEAAKVEGTQAPAPEPAPASKGACACTSGEPMSAMPSTLSLLGLFGLLATIRRRRNHR